MSGNSRSGTIVRWITGVALLCALLAGQASISPMPTAHADFVPSTFSPPEGFDFGTVRVNHVPSSVDFRTEFFTNTTTFALAGIQLQHYKGQSPLSDFVSQFVIRGETCQNLILRPGQSCTIPVAFAPFSAGAVFGIYCLQRLRGVLLPYRPPGCVWRI